VKYIYSVSDILKHNQEYNVSENLPGALLMGTDGGGEALVMDLREDSETYGGFFAVPFIPMTWKEARLMGKSLAEAISNFEK
jgi:hypothetical protein